MKFYRVTGKGIDGLRTTQFLYADSYRDAIRAATLVRELEYASEIDETTNRRIGPKVTAVPNE